MKQPREELGLQDYCLSFLGYNHGLIYTYGKFISLIDTKFCELKSVEYRDAIKEARRHEDRDDLVQNISSTLYADIAHSLNILPYTSPILLQKCIGMLPCVYDHSLVTHLCMTHHYVVVSDSSLVIKIICLNCIEFVCHLFKCFSVLQYYH